MVLSHALCSSRSSSDSDVLASARRSACSSMTARKRLRDVLDFGRPGESGEGIDEVDQRGVDGDRQFGLHTILREVGYKR